MTEKRFTNIEHDYENAWIKCNDNGDFMMYAIYKELDESLPSLEDLLNGLADENKKLKLQNEELLYQIGEMGKNNKTCRECECFIPENKYCYMWDMEVEADDVVVACDQRKIKNINEMISDD